MVQTAGIVLAGGEGMRLGGTFKPGLRIGGIRLLDSAIENMKASVSPLVISTGGHDLARFADWQDLPLVADSSESGFAGPVAGLFSCLDAVGNLSPDIELILTCAVDTPFLPSGYASRMLEGLGKADVAFATCNGQIYPTHALWRVAALENIQQAKIRINPGLRHLLPAEKTALVSFETGRNSDPFAGLNTLADLVKIAQIQNR